MIYIYKNSETSKYHMTTIEATQLVQATTLHIPHLCDAALNRQ